MDEAKVSGRHYDNDIKGVPCGGLINGSKLES